MPPHNNTHTEIDSTRDTQLTSWFVYLTPDTIGPRIQDPKYDRKNSQWEERRTNPRVMATQVTSE